MSRLLAPLSVAVLAVVAAIGVVVYAAMWDAFGSELPIVASRQVL